MKETRQNIYGNLDIGDPSGPQGSVLKDRRFSHSVFSVWLVSWQLAFIRAEEGSLSFLSLLL